MGLRKRYLCEACDAISLSVGGTNETVSNSEKPVIQDYKADFYFHVIVSKDCRTINRLHINKVSGSEEGDRAET